MKTVRISIIAVNMLIGLFDLKLVDLNITMNSEVLCISSRDTGRYSEARIDLC